MRSAHVRGDRKGHSLLLTLPKYGPVKVNKVLSRCKIAPAKTIAGLKRQRNELAALLAD